MEVTDINEISKPYKNAVLTIGNFDGVHKGHLVLLDKVREKADSMNGTAIAMTFEPHPIRVLKKNTPPQHITLYEQKVELLSQTGLDFLIRIPFTEKFASITAKEFVEEWLVKRIGMKTIVVGKDYSFGKHREGDVNFLKTCAAQSGFEVVVVDWQQISTHNTTRISSTKIRELVMEGKIEAAEKLLGRYYQIRGQVVRGRDRGGKLLGFPTANINLHDELCPKTGVYAVTVECETGRYRGVANIGYSPTFDDHVFTVEVHLLDFDEDIYGQKIRVNFVSRLRGEIKFSNIPELSNQITKDIEKARKILPL